MADPSWIQKQDERFNNHGGAPLAGLDDGGASARGQSAELMAAEKEVGQRPYAFGDPETVLKVGKVELVPPPFLGDHSKRAFRQMKTAVEGARLTQVGLFWAAVILAGLSTPEEFAMVTGVTLDKGQLPLGSEADAIAAMPGVLRYTIHRIVVGMIADPTLNEEESRYWDSVKRRFGDM